MVRPAKLSPEDLSALSANDMLAEINALRQSLDEAQETLRAISAGEIDAVLIKGEDSATVMTLGPSDSPYRILLDESAQARAVVSPDGVILHVNAALTKLLQRTPEELTGTLLGDLVEPGSLAALRALFREGAEAEAEKELILRNRAGQRIPLSLGVRPLKDNPAGPSLLLSDYTEERLRDRIISEEILAQSILEQVADAIIVCDASGRIIRASRTVEAMTGPDPLQRYFDEVVPLRAFIDGNESQTLSFQAIMQSPTIRGWDVEYTDPRGNTYNLLLNVGFLYGPEGTARGAVITLTDITARKRVESALELADRRKNEFLAILAHELRNPLAPISNSVSILSSGKLSAEVQDKALSMMDRQVKQMVRLVDDLMDVSRITRGKIELKKEKVDLAEVLKVAVETANPLIGQFDHTLAADLPDTPVWLEADFTRLSQVFSNLLNNAAKYSLPKGEIRLFTRMDGDFVTVHVADKGIGIRPEMLGRIFDMFAQVDDSLERAHGGLGVGLTLVKTLVEMHGGSITASSAGPDKGSEFVVRLPVAPVATAPKAVEPVAAGEEHGHMRVMIVEDNDALAQTTGWLVEMLGYDYSLARSGPEALANVGAYKPDVMMLDIGLPGMNGYDLCRTLRQDPALKDTIFIAQTGWGQDEHRQMARDAGFHHHMVKPLSFDALENLLGSIEKARRENA